MESSQNGVNSGDCGLRNKRRADNQYGGSAATKAFSEFLVLHLAEAINRIFRTSSYLLPRILIEKAITTMLKTKAPKV